MLCCDHNFRLPNCLLTFFIANLNWYMGYLYVQEGPAPLIPKLTLVYIASTGCYTPGLAVFKIWACQIDCWPFDANLNWYMGYCLCTRRTCSSHTWTDTCVYSFNASTGCYTSGLAVFKIWDCQIVCWPFYCRFKLICFVNEKGLLLSHLNWHLCI